MDMFGTTWPVFIGLTVVLFGWAGWSTGNALAITWRPMWQLLPYGLLLAAGDRFFDYALFQNDLLSPLGYVLSAIVIFLFSIASYRMALTRKMVLQYPWLYERAGPFAWRERPSVRIAV
ncbi:MAG TPA: hypothetical protein VL574_10020 [Stellaceae bacterium]|jgi:branched-chain amino acid transport system ATP-binding protein|nr:hypothetical protein [Stellaceae bacterium]